MFWGVVFRKPPIYKWLIQCEPCQVVGNIDKRLWLLHSCLQYHLYRQVFHPTETDQLKGERSTFERNFVTDACVFTKIRWHWNLAVTRQIYRIPFELINRVVVRKSAGYCGKCASAWGLWVGMIMSFFAFYLIRTSLKWGSNRFCIKWKRVPV